MSGPDMSVKLYAALLRMLPRRFRDAYGEDMVELFAWQLAQRTTRRARLRFQAGALRDLAVQAVRERARPTFVKDTERRRSPMVETLLYDLRFAVRGLVRRPGMTVPLVLALGLGIGLAAAMVTVAEGVLLRPLPYASAERLVVLRERTETGGLLPASYANFADWRAQARALDGVAAVAGPQNTTVLGAGEPRRASALFVTADYFDIAGIPPVLGRLFGAEENRPGGPPVVVVSQRFWLDALGAPADLAGTSIIAQDLLGRTESYDVVGVLPAGFSLMGEADVYLPLERAVPWSIRGNHVVSVLGRLVPGATTETAVRDLDRIQSAIHEVHAGETEAVGVGITALREEVVGSVRTPVLLLLTGAGLLLLASFLNAGGALLARGLARRQELLVRGSLGATPARIAAMLLVESLVIGGTAFLAAMGVARLLLLVLRRMDGGMLPRLSELDPGSGMPIVAAGGIAAIGVLLFGGMSALLTTRGARAAAVRGSLRTTRGVWRALISAEVALAIMLLSTAGVLGRSLWGILTAETGFRVDGVLTAQVNVPAQRYLENGAFTSYFDEAVRTLGADPAIESAGVGSSLPLPGRGAMAGPVQLPSGETSDLRPEYRIADAGYFRALDIRLLRGRLFDERDAPGAPHAAVVNRTMADLLWPGEDAIGQRFTLGGMDPYRDEWLTVVGIVEEARPWSSAPGTVPAYYVHARQRPILLAFLGAELVMRARGTTPIAGTIREKLAAIDGEVPIRIATLEDRLASGTADRRLVLSLLTLFAALALVASAVGIWGIVSFIVTRSRKEAGIRLALGARPGQILRSIQAQTVPPVAAGLLGGLAGAAALGGLVRAMLYGVGPFDAIAIAAACSVVIATAWLASYVPARRLRRLDPASTLRPE